MSASLWIDIKLGQHRFHMLNLDHPDVEYVFFSGTTFDEFVKSSESVMPDSIRLQNILNLLDSGFRRNNGKEHF